MYVYDGLGSVLAEVDGSGNLTKGRTYDVYGFVRKEHRNANASRNRFVGALGHTSEDESDLITKRAIQPAGDVSERCRRRLSQTVAKWGAFNRR